MFIKLLLTLFMVFQVYLADENTDCPRIITKSQWGGKQHTNLNYLITPIPYAVIQHTAGPTCDRQSRCSSIVQSIQEYHMDTLGWDDIGYSFLIGGDGNVYEGCGWTAEGAHTYGYNKKSIGIAFIGNFEARQASQKMLDAALKLIRCGKSKEILRDDVRVIAARQVTSTVSPGMELFIQIQDWPEWASNP